MVNFRVLYGDESNKATIIKEYKNIFGKEVSKVIKKDVTYDIARRYEDGKQDYYTLFEYIKNTLKKENKDEKEVLAHLKNAYVAKAALEMTEEYLKKDNKYLNMSRMDIEILSQSYEYGNEFKGDLKEKYINMNELLEDVQRAKGRLNSVIVNLNQTKNRLIRKNIITNEDMIKFETDRDRDIKKMKKDFIKAHITEQDKPKAFSDEFAENFKNSLFQEKEKERSKKIINEVHNEIDNLNNNLKRDIRSNDITLDF